MPEPSKASEGDYIDSLIGRKDFQAFLLARSIAMCGERADRWDRSGSKQREQWAIDDGYFSQRDYNMWRADGNVARVFKDYLEFRGGCSEILKSLESN